MGKKRRSGLHKKRGRFATVLAKLGLVALTVILLVLALTIFFRVDTIRVEGGRQYEAQEILNVAGIKKGDNMFFINKSEVSERLFRDLPYVCNVTITRYFPSSVTLRIEESASAAILKYQGTSYILNAKAKVMDELTGVPDSFSAEIIGLKVELPEVGKVLEGTLQEDKDRIEELSALLTVLEQRGLLSQAQSIRLDYSDHLLMEYAGRFHVLIPYGADYDYKIRSLLAVEEKLELNETGTIDMTRADGEVHFLP